MRLRHTLYALLAGALCFASGSGSSLALEDPTRPPAYTAVASPADASGEPALVLTSTLISPGRRQAVINGRTVRAGQRIGDARVLAIAPDHVRMQRGDEIFTLDLLSVAVKKSRSLQSGGHP